LISALSGRLAAGKERAKDCIGLYDRLVCELHLSRFSLKADSLRLNDRKSTLRRKIQGGYGILLILEPSFDKGGHDIFREIVIFEDEFSRESHKALFSLDDACYRRNDNNIVNTILEAAQSGLSKLHISAGWENMLKIAVWSCDRPPIHEVLALIRKTGVKEEELRPFSHSDINDIFPWLYYSNRFDILRKICNAAKSKIESKIDSRKVLVYCHLVSEGTKKIVASSL
jgi:hypothetical protein